MKKYIVLFFTVCALIFTVSAHAEDIYNEINFRKMTVEGFETDFSDGNTFFKSAKDNKAPDEIVVTDFGDEEHGKVLKITNGKDGKYKSEAVQKGFGTNEQSVVVMEHDWYFTKEGDDDASWKHIINGNMSEFIPIKVNDSGSWLLKFSLSNEGELTIKDSVTGERFDVAQLRFDTWMHIKFVFDLRTDTLSTFIDGVPTAQNVRIVGATSDVKYIQYFGMKLYVSGTENLYHWYVDNAKHYLLYPKYSAEVEYEDKNGEVCEGGAVPYDYLKIKLKFSEVMKKETVIPSSFVLKDSAQNEVHCTGVYDEEENAFIIELENALSANSEYTIEIADTVVTDKNAAKLSNEPVGFKTKKTPVGIESVTLDKGSLNSYEAGSEAQVTVALRDELASSPDVRIIAGIYNEKMMAVSINVLKVDAVVNGAECSLSLKIPSDIESEEYKLHVIMASGDNVWAPYDSFVTE